MKSLDYACGVSYVRAQETKLLKTQEVERMIDAKDFITALRVLNDLDVGKYLQDADATNFSKKLDHVLYDAKKLLEDFAPNDSFSFLWLKYDFHNLKVLLKSKIVGRDMSDIYFDVLSSFTKAQFIKWQDDDTYTDMPKDYREALTEAMIFYKKDENPQMIDVVLDNYYVTKMLHLMRGRHSAYLAKYKRALVDLNNIKNAFRIRFGSEISYSLIYQSGGGVSYDKLLKIIDSESDEISILQTTDYYHDFKTGYDLIINEKRFEEFEKDVDNYLLAIFKEAEFIAMGMEPMMVYFLVQELNTRTMRIILNGKLANLEMADIRNKIRNIFFK